MRNVLRTSRGVARARASSYTDVEPPDWGDDCRRGSVMDAPQTPTPPGTAATQASSLPPSGWYTNPNGPGQRYWDGQQWTDNYSPAQPAAPISAGEATPGVPGLVVAGYIFAILIPVVGFILGIVAVTRSDKRISKHGVWIIVLSVVVGIIAVAVIAVSASSSGAPKGLNDPGKLAKSIEENSEGTKVHDVFCVHASGPQFTCNAKNPENEPVTLEVTVAANGESWVSK